MFRNMVTSLISHERIVTTEVKASEIARITEKMITLGKRGDLHARRQAVAYVRTNEAVKRLFTVYQARYADRQGGYTRILKLEPRPGDNAPMAIVELVDRPIEKAKEKGPKEKKETKAQSAKTREKKTADKEPPGKTSVKKEKEEKAESPKKKAPAKKGTAEKKDTKTRAKAPAEKSSKQEKTAPKEKKED